MIASRVDDFEKCVDQLSTDVMDLLRSSRSGVERLVNIARPGVQIDERNEVAAVSDVTDRRIPSTGPLSALCQQLNHELCRKEQIIQLQGHAFTRQLRLAHSRSETEITRRCYALLFEVDELRRTNESLKAERTKLHDLAVKDARRMFRNQVSHLLFFLDSFLT